MASDPQEESQLPLRSTEGSLPWESNMAGWKISYKWSFVPYKNHIESPINGGFCGKIPDFCGPFSSPPCLIPRGYHTSPTIFEDLDSTRGCARRRLLGFPERSSASLETSDIVAGIGKVEVSTTVGGST